MTILLVVMLAIGSFAAVGSTDAILVGVYGRVIFDDSDGHYIIVKWYDDEMEQLGNTCYVYTSGDEYSIEVYSDPGNNCTITAQQSYGFSMLSENHIDYPEDYIQGPGFHWWHHKAFVW